MNVDGQGSTAVTRDRHVQRWLRLALCAGGILVAAVLLGSISAAAHSAATPRASKLLRPKTLLTVPGSIVAFAQDGDHVVWGNDADCGRIVELRTLSTGASSFLDARNGPMCGGLIEYTGMQQQDMALAGTRALWAYFSISLSGYGFDLFTAAPGDRTERYVDGFGIEGGLEDVDLFRPALMAGDGTTLVYARPESGSRPAQLYGVVGQRARPVAGTEGAFAAAVVGLRLALARRIPGGDCACNSSPAWSPDGRRIAFLSGRAGGFGSQLFVMNADGTESRLLMEGVDRFAWAPDGAAIAVQKRTGNLVVVGPDGGGARVVARGLSSGLPDRFAWSPDARRIAYTATVGGTSRLYVVPASGGAAVDLGTYGESGTTYVTVAWSPDSRRLAHTRYVGGQLHLYVVPASGGAAADLGVGEAPSWSPDGAAIAFSRRADGVYVMSSNGSGVRRIAAIGQDWAATPAWSPDGRWIAFFADRSLWLVRPDGGPPREFSLPSGGGRVDWSPNSRALAFTGDTVTIMDVESGGLRSIAAGDEPSWSPDGSRLVYEAFVATEQSEIAVVDADGGNPILLTRTEQPAPERMVVETRSRDGKLQSSFEAPLRLAGLAFSGSRVALVVSRTNGWTARQGPSSRSTIEIRNVAGKLLRRVDVPRPAFDQLSMSGRWIVFRTGPVGEGRDRANVIRLLDAETGRTTILARPRVAVVVGLSIDGRRVAWAEPNSRASRIRAVILPSG